MLLLVTSAITAHGTDLRASPTLGVNQRITLAQRDIAQLTRQADSLRATISAATGAAAGTDSRIRAAQAQAAKLAAAAGLTAVDGPAVTVSLDDAPRSAVDRDLAAGAPPGDLGIHPQDGRRGVNAVWGGGGPAETIMGGGGG